jgi:membrane-associated phospholipid phosphatase
MRTALCALLALACATTALASPAEEMRSAEDAPTAVPAPEAAASASAPCAPHTTASVFHRGDLVFWGGAASVIALAAVNDRWLTAEAREVTSPDQRRLAHWVQPLGNGALVLPAAFGAWAIGRWTDHPGIACRAARVGGAVIVAGGVTVALKECVGRSRPLTPSQSPGDFQPFSGHDAFPSGHAAIAFATAAALQRETSSRWIPYVAYASAALVAWERVHDTRHWTSDVVAGAAVGGWTAWKADTWLAGRGAPGRTSAHLERGDDGGLRWVISRALR